MKIHFVKLLCCLMMMLCLAGRASYADTPKPKLSIGSEAPPLSVLGWWQDRELPGIEKGHVYVVDFWASWCGPCRESMPYLLGLRKKYNDQSIDFVGISIDSDPDAAEDYLKAMGTNNMAIYFGIDEGGKTWDAWGHAAGKDTIPTTFLVGRDGKIAWFGHPMQVENALFKLLNN